jgi:hypothetical protein
MDLEAAQRPLKDSYRADPATARITLGARAGEAGAPTGCSVDLGRALQAVQTLLDRPRVATELVVG